jgi:hypothetical protein
MIQERMVHWYSCRVLASILSLSSIIRRIFLACRRRFAYKCCVCCRFCLVLQMLDLCPLVRKPTTSISSETSTATTVSKNFGCDPYSSSTTSGANVTVDEDNPKLELLVTQRTESA